MGYKGQRIVNLADLADDDCADLQKMVAEIEAMRDKAMVGDLKFLAYLLGMARIEAASLLNARIPSKRSGSPAG